MISPRHSNRMEALIKTSAPSKTKQKSPESLYNQMYPRNRIYPSGTAFHLHPVSLCSCLHILSFLLPWDAYRV